MLFFRDYGTKKPAVCLLNIVDPSIVNSKQSLQCALSSYLASQLAWLRPKPLGDHRLVDYNSRYLLPAWVDEAVYGLVEEQQAPAKKYGAVYRSVELLRLSDHPEDGLKQFAKFDFVFGWNLFGKIPSWRPKPMPFGSGNDAPADYLRGALDVITKACVGNTRRRLRPVVEAGKGDCQWGDMVCATAGVKMKLKADLRSGSSYVIGEPTTKLASGIIKYPVKWKTPNGADAGDMTVFIGCARKDSDKPQPCNLTGMGVDFSMEDLPRMTEAYLKSRTTDK